MADTTRKLDIQIRPRGGGEYDSYVVARVRRDGRFDGLLEFRAAADAPALTSGVQTTQATIDDVFRWAAGLSVSHVENAYAVAASPREISPAGYSAVPTPPSAYERLEQLRGIERDVLSMFTTRGSTRMRTQEVFDHGPHANADFVRAFEELDKRWRYLVRHTQDGVDWLDLTAAGARAAGLPEEGATNLPGERAKPVR